MIFGIENRSPRNGTGRPRMVLVQIWTTVFKFIWDKDQLGTVTRSPGWKSQKNTEPLGRNVLENNATVNMNATVQGRKKYSF